MTQLIDREEVLNKINKIDEAIADLIKNLDYGVKKRDLGFPLDWNTLTYKDFKKVILANIRVINQNTNRIESLPIESQWIDVKERKIMRVWDDDDYSRKIEGLFVGFTSDGDAVIENEKYGLVRRNNYEELPTPPITNN